MHCSQFTVSQFFFEGVALLHGIISYTYLYIFNNINTYKSFYSLFARNKKL